jgi:hypothetical protein
MPASRGGRDRPSYEEFLEILRSIHNGQEGPVRRAADLLYWKFKSRLTSSVK